MVRRTRIPLNQTLRVYEITASEFGDAQTVGDYHEIKALVEDTQGFENAENMDSLTGTLLAHIEPTDPFYVQRNGDLEGLVAQFSRFNNYDEQSWYRIASVHPGESLIGGGADLVELTLTRIADRDEYEDES